MIFHDLEFLTNFFKDAQIMFYLSMLMMFVMLLQVITFFNGLFPAFGLHLLTLNKAKVDLIIILIYMILVLITFAVFANISQGSVHSEFATFTQSMIYLYNYV